jgi:toxin ParE1/3/4
MAVYSLSAKAATDLDGIYEYTIRKFGLEQAPDLRCSEYQSHVAFYVPKAGGVRIIRVLHESMDVKRHLER